MRSRRPRCKAKGPPLAAIAATLLVSSAAAAQQQAQVSISAGAATDQRGVRSNALTVAPSLFIAPTSRTSLALGASATRFGGEAWSLGGAAALFGQDQIAGPLSIAIDASGSASRFNGEGIASAIFASGDMSPTLQVRLRPATIFGGVRLATGYASRDLGRPGLPLLSAPEIESRTTTGAGGTLGVDFIGRAIPDVTLRLGAREDVLRVSGVTVADHSLSAGITSGSITVSGSAGRRDASDERVRFGSASISLALTTDLALQGGAGRYASNRLTGTAGGTYMDAGLSIRFGGAAALRPPRAAPRVDGAPRLARGYTRLAIAAPDAQRVEVAGDFNSWTPVPARRVERGVWYTDLRIPPGQYRYAFRVNAKEWRVPRGATAVDDGFGGKSVWLVVGEASN